ADSAPSQPAQIDHATQRVERLRGADIRCRALSTDVLLARLQGQHEPAPTILIACLSGDPSRQPAQQRLGGGEEAEGGTAEVKPAPERLALADGEIDPAFARWLEDPQGNGITRTDRERTRLAGAGRKRVEVLDGAQEIWLLHHQRAGVGI